MSAPTKLIRIGKLNVYIGKDRDILLRHVFNDFPGKTVLNGNDCSVDPMMWVSMNIKRWDVKPLAFFHSGPSKDFWSGCVIEPDDLFEIKRRFRIEYTMPLEEVIQVYHDNIPS